MFQNFLAEVRLHSISSKNLPVMEPQLSHRLGGVLKQAELCQLLREFNSLINVRCLSGSYRTA
jgi:hypothetical protein